MEYKRLYLSLLLLCVSTLMNAQQVFTYVDPTDTTASHKLFLTYSDASRTSLMVIAAPEDSTSYSGEVEIPVSAEITDTVNNEEPYTTILPVDRIDKKAFSETSITSIKMGNVTSIGSTAFANCEKLTTVTISNSVRSIGINAFQGCNNIYTVNYPSTNAFTYITYENESSNPLRFAKIVLVNGVDQSSQTISRNINAYAFYGAKWLENIVIQEGVESIGKAAFRECSNLKSIKFNGTDFKSIGIDAFNGCTSLTDIILPESLEEIGVAAFRNCWKLKRITIPENTTSIGNETFFGCGQLKEVELYANITDIPTRMFCACTGLEKVKLGKNITTIGDDAFSGCTSLISFPEGGNIKEILVEAFINCNGFKDLTLPESLKMVGKRAFSGCKNLTNLFILKNVNDLVFATEAFTSTNLKNIYAYPLVAPTADQSTFGETPQDINLFVDSLATGYDVEPWSNLNKIVFNFKTITYFIDDKEAYCDTLQVGKEISLRTDPNKPDWEFSGWVEKDEIPSVMPNQDLIIHGYFSKRWHHNGLTYLIKPTKTETMVLADAAYYKEMSQPNIHIPELINYKDSIFKDSIYVDTTYVFRVTAIEAHAFENCTDMQEIELPNNLKQIGNGAFMGSGLTSISLPETITSVADSLFLNCEELSTATLPNSIKSIGKAAFYGCSSLIMDNLPAQLNTISDFAFCKSGITDMNVPESITSMGTRVFEGCSQLDSVYFAPNFALATLPDYTFFSCRRLKGFTLSPLTTSIGTGAFQGCKSIQQLILENGIKEIGSNAFYECTGLESIILPQTIERIKNNAFGDCKVISQITINDRTEAPIAAASSFSDETYDNASLFITDINEYRNKSPWKRFGNRIFTITDKPMIYMVDGNIYGDTLTVRVGTTITPIAVPQKDGHSFSGWKGLPSIMPNDTVRITGFFKYQFTYIDCDNKETVYTDSLFHGEDLPDFKNDLPKKLSKDGYRYEIIDTILKMPANDTIINVRYIPTETDFTDSNGLRYHIFTEINEKVDYVHAELMSGEPTYTSSEIEIPDSIEYIGRKYPVTVIQKDAFKGSFNLTTISLPDNINTIGTQAFKNCANLQKIEIPVSTTTLGEELFWGCKNLKEVVFLSANAITKLPANIFQDCESLESIELPSSIQYIYADAFRDCENLLEIEIPQSVDSIGKRVFNGCGKLAKIYITNKNKLPKASEETFDKKAYDTATLYISSELQGNLTAPWDNFMNTEIGDTINIGPCAQPVINYIKGKLQFTCATPDATITSEIKIADAQKSQNPNQQLTQTYIITAYASAKGYKRSPVTTVTLRWKSSSATLETSENFGQIEYQIEDEEGQVGLPGDINGDKKITAEDAVLILKQITGNKEENNNGE